MLDRLRDLAEQARAYLRASVIFLFVSLPAAIFAAHGLSGSSNGFVAMLIMTAWFVVMHWSMKLAGWSFRRDTAEEEDV